MSSSFNNIKLYKNLKELYNIHKCLTMYVDINSAADSAVLLPRFFIPTLDESLVPLPDSDLLGYYKHHHLPATPVTDQRNITSITAASKCELPIFDAAEVYSIYKQSLQKKKKIPMGTDEYFSATIASMVEDKEQK